MSARSAATVALAQLNRLDAMPLGFALKGMTIGSEYVIACGRAWSQWRTPKCQWRAI